MVQVNNEKESSSLDVNLRLCVNLVNLLLLLKNGAVHHLSWVCLLLLRHIVLLLVCDLRCNIVLLGWALHNDIRRMNSIGASSVGKLWHLSHGRLTHHDLRRDNILLLHLSLILHHWSILSRVDTHATSIDILSRHHCGIRVVDHYRHGNHAWGSHCIHLLVKVILLY